MESFISNFDFWNFLGGLITGLVGGSFLTLAYRKSTSVIGSGSSVDQSGAKASGNIVGRDNK